MGFYGKEPVETAKATYVWTGLGTPGFYFIEATGEAQNFSYGFKLERESQFVGGLMVNVMGMTGPVGEGTSKFTVQGHFSGEYRKEIFVSGSNKTIKVQVEEIPKEQAEDWVKKHAS